MTKSMIDLPELIAKSEDGDFWSPSLGVSGIHVASEGNVGWSIPLGVATIGETYTPEGTYGTFSAGSPVAGIEAGFHEDNPEPGMASAGRNFELLDHNDNLVDSAPCRGVGTRLTGLFV